METSKSYVYDQINATYTLEFKRSCFNFFKLSDITFKFIRRHYSLQNTSNLCINFWREKDSNSIVCIHVHVYLNFYYILWFMFKQLQSCLKLRAMNCLTQCVLYLLKYKADWRILKSYYSHILKISLKKDDNKIKNACI